MITYVTKWHTYVAGSPRELLSSLPSSPPHRRRRHTVVAADTPNRGARYRRHNVSKSLLVVEYNLGS